MNLPSHRVNSFQIRNKKFAVMDNREKGNYFRSQWMVEFSPMVELTRILCTVRFQFYEPPNDVWITESLYPLNHTSAQATHSHTLTCPILTRYQYIEILFDYPLDLRSNTREMGFLDIWNPSWIKIKLIALHAAKSTARKWRENVAEEFFT